MEDFNMKNFVFISLLLGAFVFSPVFAEEGEAPGEATEEKSPDTKQRAALEKIVTLIEVIVDRLDANEKNNAEVQNSFRELQKATTSGSKNLTEIVKLIESLDRSIQETAQKSSEAVEAARGEAKETAQKNSEAVEAVKETAQKTNESVERTNESVEIVRTELARLGEEFGKMAAEASERGNVFEEALSRLLSNFKHSDIDTVEVAKARAVTLYNMIFPEEAFRVYSSDLELLNSRTLRRVLKNVMKEYSVDKAGRKFNHEGFFKSLNGFSNSLDVVFGSQQREGVLGTKYWQVETLPKGTYNFFESYIEQLLKMEKKSAASKEAPPLVDYAVSQQVWEVFRNFALYEGADNMQNLKARGQVIAKNLWFFANRGFSVEALRSSLALEAYSVSVGEPIARFETVAKFAEHHQPKTEEAARRFGRLGDATLFWKKSDKGETAETEKVEKPGALLEEKPSAEEKAAEVAETGAEEKAVEKRGVVRKVAGATGGAVKATAKGAWWATSGAAKGAWWATSGATKGAWWATKATAKGAWWATSGTAKGAFAVGKFGVGAVTYPARALFGRKKAKETAGNAEEAVNENNSEEKAENTKQRGRFVSALAKVLRGKKKGGAGGISIARAEAPTNSAVAEEVKSAAKESAKSAAKK